MQLKNNTVWILQGNESLAVLSTREYAEEYKRSLIEIWLKSISYDAILPTLNNREEIEDHADEYPDVIIVDDDHYSLVKGWASNPGFAPKEWWRYELMSNREWKEYFERFTDDFVIEEYKILK
jgi:hypothetical protein